MFTETDYEWGECSDAGLTELPVVVFDGVGGEIQDKGLKLVRVIIKDGFEALRRSIINSIFLIIIIILNSTQGLEQPGNNLIANFSSDIIFHISNLIHTTLILSR